MNSQTRGWLILLVLIAGGWLVISRIDAGPRDRTFGEVFDSIHAATYARFQSEYGAMPAWPQDTTSSFPDGSDAWTVDLQRRWIDPARPIITTVVLLDVARDSIGYVAVFGPSYLGLGNAFLRLRVPEGMTSTLLRDRDGFYDDEYIIVATIASVRRPPLTIELKFDDVERFAWLEPGSTNYFLATGVLHAAQILSW